MIENILGGLGLMFTWDYNIALWAGAVLGFMVGILPGISATMGVALMIPVTFAMEPAPAMAMLVGVYCASYFGGGITACLVNIPGTPAAVATVLDGYPMAQKGRPERALGTVAFASLVGGILSTALLLLTAEPLARFALKFGPAEYFLLALWGLLTVAAIGTKSVVKGLISAVIGLLLGVIGMDPIMGYPRYTGGHLMLYEGVDIIVVLIGLFSMSEVLVMASGYTSGGFGKRLGKLQLPIRDFWKHKVNYFRSSLIGTFVGALPAAGAVIAVFLSYDQARKWSSHPEEFGQGCDEGIIAAEAANNGTAGGSFIPTLSLGIPGNAVTAVLMGGLMIHGLAPGPRLFVESPDLVYSIILSGFAATVVAFLLMVGVGRYVGSMTGLPKGILIPTIAVLSVVGAFAMRNSVFDVFVMLAVGVIGYFLRKYDYSLAAVTIAVVLGPMAEAELRRALLIHGSAEGFLFSSPICITLFILILATFIVPRLLAARRGGKGT